MGVVDTGGSFVASSSSRPSIFEFLSILGFSKVVVDIESLIISSHYL